MLLSYRELTKLVESGVIDADPENINGASIDLTLDRNIFREVGENRLQIIDLKEKQLPKFIMESIGPDGFDLWPGQFILANTRETFNLPDDIAAEFKLKSSVARAGLNHLLAGFADPGWHHAKLTLELHNVLMYHIIRLREGMKIGQMIFYRVQPVPSEQSYSIKGRYNHTTTVTASKGV